MIYSGYHNEYGVCQITVTNSRRFILSYLAQIHFIICIKRSLLMTYFSLLTHADVLLVLNRFLHQGADSIKRCHLTSIGNPIVEIRRSYDRLISTMGFPILVRWHLYIESGPWCGGSISNGPHITIFSVIFFAPLCFHSTSLFWKHRLRWQRSRC